MWAGAQQGNAATGYLTVVRNGALLGSLHTDVTDLGSLILDLERDTLLSPSLTQVQKDVCNLKGKVPILPSGICMYMRMCICVYMCAYVCACVRLCVHVCACMCACVCTCVCACVCPLLGMTPAPLYLPGKYSTTCLESSIAPHGSLAISLRRRLSCLPSHQFSDSTWDPSHFISDYSSWEKHHFNAVVAEAGGWGLTVRPQERNQDMLTKNSVMRAEIHSYFKIKKPWYNVS